MTKEKIRQKAIECGKTIARECCMPCKECDYGDYFLAAEFSCLAVSGYEHGFADGVEEGEKKTSEIIIKNVIASLEGIKYGYGTLDEYIIELYEQVIE